MYDSESKRRKAIKEDGLLAGTTPSLHIHEMPGLGVSHQLGHLHHSQDLVRHHSSVSGNESDVASGREDELGPLTGHVQRHHHDHVHPLISPATATIPWLESVLGKASAVKWNQRFHRASTAISFNISRVPKFVWVLLCTLIFLALFSLTTYKLVRTLNSSLCVLSRRFVLYCQTLDRTRKFIRHTYVIIISRQLSFSPNVSSLFLAMYTSFLHSSCMQIIGGALDQDVEGKRMVIYSMPETLFTRAQGMFADFLAVVGAVHYARTHNAAGVRVYFDNAFYVDKERGPNWWAYFFEPVMTLRPEIEKPEETHFVRWLSRFGVFGSFSQVVTKLEHKPTKEEIKTNPFAKFPYPVNGALSIEAVRELVQKHMKLQPSAVKTVNDIRATMFAPGDFVIGVHYRGLDKIDAYPFVPAPPDLFRAAVTNVLELYKPGPNFKIYVASDTADFIDFAKAHWGADRIRYLDVPRIYVKDVQYQPDGTPVPLHKDKSISPFVKGQSAILDMLLLSTCNFIVKNRSSLSDASLAFARPINYTFILGPEDPVYSSDNRLPIDISFSDTDFEVVSPSADVPRRIAGRPCDGNNACADRSGGGADTGAGKVTRLAKKKQSWFKSLLP